MNAEQKKQVQVVWYRILISERFSSVLYPIDVIELLKQLPSIGYVVPDLVLRGTPEANRPLASKGDIELIINQDNKTLGVRGRETEKTVESLKELRQLYLERLNPSTGLVVQYIELDGEGWAISDKNPTSAFTSFWANYSPLQELGALFEENDVSNFGIQLVPANKDPNNPEYFQLNVQPHIPSASSRYHIRCIWRGADIEHLLDKFVNTDRMIQNVIKSIEGK